MYYDPYDEYMADQAPQNFEPAQRVRAARPRYEPRATQQDFSGAGVAGASTGNPYVALAGIGLEAWGSYKAADQVEEQNRMAMEAFRDERDRERRLDSQAEEQRRINNMIGMGNVARSQEQDVYGTYSPWARSQGL